MILAYVSVRKSQLVSLPFFQDSINSKDLLEVVRLPLMITRWMILTTSDVAKSKTCYTNKLLFVILSLFHDKERLIGSTRTCSADQNPDRLPPNLTI